MIPPDIASKIAEEVAARYEGSQWALLIITSLVAFIAGAAGSFLGAYFRKRGETYATKADLDELLNQLQHTTHVTESIRTQIQHNDWAVREWKQKRVVKAEELLAATRDALAETDRICRQYLFEDIPNIEGDVAGRVAMLAALYFPEARENTLRLGMLLNTQIVNAGHTRHGMNQHGEDQGAASLTRRRGMNTLEAGRGEVITIINAIEADVLTALGLIPPGEVSPDTIPFSPPSAPR